MTNSNLTEIVCIFDRSGSIEATATVSFVASPAGVRQAYADMGTRVAEARRRPRKGA